MNDIQASRRGFFGSLAAISASVADGLTLPRSDQVAKAAPRAIAVQNTLAKMIAECEPTSITMEQHVDGHQRAVVEYLYCQGRKAKDAFNVRQYTNRMRPISVKLTAQVGDIPRVTVEWA
jgi:hypothetical protein